MTIESCIEGVDLQSLMLKGMISKIYENHQVVLSEFNGESDHVHLLINYHPLTSLLKIRNTLKGITSREMKYYFLELNQVAWRKIHFGRLAILLVP
ncbi:transposase [Vibrio harveyi]